jgi:LmbE family N-acetylglucosaminyl deacetylase
MKRMKRGLVCAGITLLCIAAPSQAPVKSADPTAHLPQDIGAAGLTQMLLRLQTTARLMQVTAHPDDEDGGMLTLESRGKGATVLLMTLTRGEGGQNRLGSNLFDSLGVLRTLEQTASDRYYGVEQRFSRVADFGYSKNADETFQKWHGHDIALADLVRVIRTFHPDVLVARFSGTERDGHGHHQASAILTKEAFRAAADPNRFPEQIKEGLLPWQPKKLYAGNVCGFGAVTCPDENYTIRLNTGVVNPVLGMSYIQFALEGLRHQLSQGAGGWSVEPGDRFTHYKLVDSVLRPVKSGHEQDFFEGMDTSLPGLVARLGDDGRNLPWLRPVLTKIADRVKQAAGSSGDGAAEPLFDAVHEIDSVIEQLQPLDMSEQSKNAVLEILREKRQQAEVALALASNMTLEATVAAPKGAGALPNEQHAFAVVSPGQGFQVNLKLHNGSPKYWLTIRDPGLGTASDWIRQAHADETTIGPGEDYYASFSVRVPQNVPLTRPFWHRDDPEKETVNTVDDESYAALALPLPVLQAHVKYEIAGQKGLHSPAPDFLKKKKLSQVQEGEMTAEVLAPFVDEHGAERRRRVAIAPAFSVMLEPAEQVVPVDLQGATAVKVAVASNLTGAPDGNLQLQLPSGWRAEPERERVNLPKRGDKKEFEFKVFPGSLKEGRAEIRAELSTGRQRYADGYTLITREDLDAFNYYQQAVQHVSIVDMKIPKDLKIGYVMGAGDDIPTVLQQIGMDVTLLSAEKLASEDLSRYRTIVLGIRAYDTQKAVAANNKKLLDFVSAGGTLVAQYNTGVGDFNSGHYTPYPAQLSRARVSVEEAPVEILAPDDPIFHYPNQITQHDFDDWVQERGLYFMDQWDSNLKPLLSCHDPGEPPQKGGLLKAQYGKGTYMYSAYAFFRQVPAGVPGAIRLYVNLLSAGEKRPLALSR